MLSVSHLFSLLGLASIAISAPHEKRAQTIYLAGDSTMAESGGGSGTQGWGHYLQYSLSLPVSNKAIAGRSARSYTVENRFQTLIDTVKTNDIVIIEFGHNDGGSLSSSDNGRTDCPGAGSETCTSTYNGQTVTVLTYPAYLVNAGKALVAKGAKVIISSPTPNNPWESGTFSYSASRFTTYSKSAAQQIGSSAMFVDHGQYTANIFKTMGKATVDTFFPNDHTHTSPAGADAVSRAFVKAVLCASGGVLDGFVKNSTASVEGSCV
ncbi:secreted rhamnogalacturonan acetylesteras-like protein [Lindgomyces ingoldianus]|uniref:Secreted rhamnogalacturonan acetylesteras-like protein n=1 Tax=Lindgomyces ingoldianus TaxID=673940 RepID=A0ACB6R2E1_9PLEO|nr:secreted rhamnogalacturonan acetylesteras-like protein [Lindgomyces ingoldianus]KAF2473341.1 secreted rhamnogalacturonan acetylesteras-like protein [Lindgomyces ingoldianus]